MSLIIGVLLIILSVLLSLWYYQKFRYFKNLGIEGPTPGWFGNTPNAFFKKRHLSYEIDAMYRKYKNVLPFVGYFDFLTPYLLVIDTGLARQIMVKDFKHFRNNEFGGLTDKKKDPVMALNPFVMRDEEWKLKRTEVAIGMTQNKMKSIFPLIDDIGEKFSEYIRKEIQESPNKSFSARDICVRYTCECVCECIFAIDGGSFKNDDSEIIAMADRMIRSISDAATSLFPRRMMPQDVEKFFIHVMEEALKHRSANGIQRDDFLNHILELREKKGISDGYDTTSVALCPLFFELAKHQNVQDKLRDEIRLAESGTEKISYKELMDLPYLDQVIYESLRMNPPLTFSSRECSETIELEGLKGHKFRIEKGLRIFIPILSIHHDPGRSVVLLHDGCELKFELKTPEHYYEPDVFIPERFDAVNGGVKAFRDKGVLIPFGDGPRICLGMRFALLQLKTAAFKIIKNFKITVDPKMSLESNPEIDPGELLMNVKKGGILLNFKAF